MAHTGEMVRDGLDERGCQPRVVDALREDLGEGHGHLDLFRLHLSSLLFGRHDPPTQLSRLARGVPHTCPLHFYSTPTVEDKCSNGHKCNGHDANRTDFASRGHAMLLTWRNAPLSTAARTRASTVTQHSMAVCFQRTRRVAVRVSQSLPPYLLGRQPRADTSESESDD